MANSSSLSLLHGPAHQPLWQKSVGSLTDEQADLYGDRSAVIVPWQSVRLSFRELADRSWVIADALLKFGLRHGDCVGIVAGNRYEYLEAFLGATRLGCPVVVLNNTYTPDELQNALQTTSK
jgi:acyl-CoA synthetase (AMP-forming)/AMP-acid ligase II